MMDFFNKLSKKERIGLSIAVGFITLAVLDRLVIKPIKDKVDRLNHQIQVSEEELRLDLRNLQEKKVISREYEKYTQYVTKAGSDEEEVAKILAEIEEMARRSNVNLVDITPQAPREIDFYREYAAEIEIMGSMESVVKFLYRLSNSMLLLRAQKLRMTLKGDESKNVAATILVTKILVF